MNTDTFKNRFNLAMSKANIKPTELARKTNLSKSTISHYMSGYTHPKTDKLLILSKALNVSASWLLGYDVPMERSDNNKYDGYVSPDSIVFEITERSLQYSPEIFDAICKSLENMSTSKESRSNARRITKILTSNVVTYREKAKALKNIIDMVLIDTKRHTISLYYAYDKTPREQQMDSLFCTIQDLNDTNINKVLYYSDALLKIQKIEEPEDLMPQAAHERTDTIVTAEMIKHDDDIMDDPNF